MVLSSPIGSGKSTEVPRWRTGRTLVVEPRRIACRSPAVRVADLEGTALDERATRWTTVPSVGAVTAVTFIALVDASISSVSDRP